MLCVFHHQQNGLLSSKYLHEVFFFFCGLRYRYHSDTPVEKTPNHYLIQSFGCCLGEIVLLRYLQLFEHRALMIHTKYSLFNLTKKSCSILFDLPRTWMLQVVIRSIGDHYLQISIASLNFL